jgi:hypothetical protein
MVEVSKKFQSGRNFSPIAISRSLTTRLIFQGQKYGALIIALAEQAPR